MAQSRVHTVRAKSVTQETLIIESSAGTKFKINVLLLGISFSIAILKLLVFSMESFSFDIVFIDKTFRFDILIQSSYCLMYHTKVSQPTADYGFDQQG